MMSDQERQKVCDNLELVDYLLQYKLHIYPGSKYYEDCQQEGRLGLIESVSRYDESRGFEFSTFASSYILGKVKTYLSEFVYGNLHISRKYKNNLTAITDMYYKGYTQSETMEKLGITSTAYLASIAVCTMTSLDDSIGVNKNGDTLYYSDIIGAEDKNINDLFEEERVIDCIEKVASSISDEKNKNIWYEYIYPAYYGEKVGQEVIALKYGVTQAYVSRLLKKYKNLLEKFLAE